MFLQCCSYACTISQCLHKVAYIVHNYLDQCRFFVGRGEGETIDQCFRKHTAPGEVSSQELKIKTSALWGTSDG